MRLLVFCLLFFALTACTTNTIVVTATRPPADPTPSAEPGCGVPTDHCHFLNDPINPNFQLSGAPITLPFSETKFRTPRGEDIQHTVQVPPPDGRYTWQWRLTGLDGTALIPGWIPDTFYSQEAYQVNITGVSGKAYLQLHGVELQANHKYVIDLQYRPDVFTIDPSKTFDQTKVSWQGVCVLYTDAGLTYPFDPQGFSDARRSWRDTSAEHVTISLKAGRDMTMAAACGVNLLYALWQGNVYFEKFVLAPVDWNDADIQKVVR
jgi:hypothetical protein